jgi:hypothetical protein
METASVELRHVMRHVSLTGDVGSPIQFMFRHLRFAVVNIGSLIRETPRTFPFRALAFRFRLWLFALFRTFAYAYCTQGKGSITMPGKVLNH